MSDCDSRHTLLGLREQVSSVQATAVVGDKEHEAVCPPLSSSCSSLVRRNSALLEAEAPAFLWLPRTDGYPSVMQSTLTLRNPPSSNFRVPQSQLTEMTSRHN